MTDAYSLKFNNGSSSFEVSGPSEAWVDAKVEELKTLLKTMPPVIEVPAPLGNGSNTRKTSKKSTPKSNPKKTDEVGTLLGDVWNEDFANKILAFVDERKEGFKGAPKQAAIVAVFLKDHANTTAINPSDLEFIYRKLSWPTINHETQLWNAVKRDKYFEKTAAGFELVHAGTVFGRDTSKAKGK